MSAKRRKFKTEVQQLLDLVVHSLYSHKEIFLRELISNASDAIDRARFESLSDQSVLEDDPEWKIKIAVDKDAKTLTVSDNGIGMGPEDIDQCIGTIANSGTRKFLEELQKNKENVPPEFIGQFGVGFYSAFMVADKVTVVTRHPGDKDNAVKWTSTGAGTYTVEQTTREKRGTDVILHLEEDAEEFLEEWRIRKIVKRFSDFVEHPVTMDVRHEEKPTDENGEPIEDAEPIVTVEEETLNSQKAIWQRPKEEIGEEEYQAFYKHVSHDAQNPFEIIHWKVEGMTEFRALLFIPEHPPMDMFIGEERKHGIHLYVRRVFITDNCEELVPQYLRFLRGVVDSSDLPLNVSREMLQEHRAIRIIRSNLVKKVLGTLADMMEKDRDRYVTFWKQFGRILKEGIHIDFENREKLHELALFESSGADAGTYLSLAEYVNQMPDSQSHIYYLTAEDRQAAENSPHLEAFRSRGINVLFMTDPIDEWVVQSMPAYDGKQLKSIARGDIDLDEEADETEDERKEVEEQFKPLLEKVKEFLGEKVKDVRLSRRLTESACCIVSDEYSIGIQMEKILKAMNQEVPPARRILELNPKHPAVQTMKTLLARDGGEEKVREYTELLHDQALLTAQLPVEDPLRFTKRISDLMAAEAKGLVEEE